MKIIECRGTSNQIGRTIGEALREEVRMHVATFAPPIDENLKRQIKYFTDALDRFMPEVRSQFQGIARGADVAEEKIYALNLPGGSGDPRFDQGCTNIVFRNGPDGPLWGKNNDGLSAGPEGRRPVAVLKIYPDQGIPAICFCFCGWLSGGDMVNAEGLAIGHSSVGSKLQQSPYHVPVLQWLYAGMLKARNVAEFARHITSVPLRGKGFSLVAVDKAGAICAPELACPLAQIRWPDPKDQGMNCVNDYRLPGLQGLTNRNPAQLENCAARRTFLEREIQEGRHDLEQIKRILRHHDRDGVCRHGREGDEAFTEYSMIGLPRAGKVLFTDGNPCLVEYTEMTF